MGKKMIYILFCLIAVNSYGQVSMTLQVPPDGVLLKAQLWNISLVNTGSLPVQVRISLTLTDALSNLPVITATSGLVSLPNGAKLLQAADAAPVKWAYPSPAVTDRNPDGFLPAGSYLACYTLLSADKSTRGTLAEDCVTFEVSPLSPPVLNMPFNEDTIQVKYPQFTWLPPTPLNIFSRLTYKFKLVEVAAGQNAADAVQQNIPVYVDNDCLDIYLNYPSSGLPLDTGKLYAWQVISQNNLLPSAQSEVWVFQVGDKHNALRPATNSYLLLDNNGINRQSHTVTGGVIAIKYHSYDNEHQADIKVAGAGGEVLQTFSRVITYGDNYLQLPLRSSLKKDHLYTIQVADINGNKYTATFVIK